MTIRDFTDAPFPPTERVAPVARSAVEQLAARHGVVRTYRGRPGCGCGCRGTYADPTDGPTATRTRMRDVAALIAAGDPVDVSGDIVTSETDRRYLWLYFTDANAAARFVVGAFVAGILARDERAAR